MQKMLAFLKNKRLPLLACAVYLACCIFLWWIQYRLYGGTVKINLLYLVIFPPVYLVCWWLRDEKEPPKQKPKPLWHKILDAAGWLLIAAITVLIGYWLIQNPYMLMGYLYFSVVFAAVVLAVYKKFHPAFHMRHPGSATVCIVYSLFAVVAALYILIAHPCTVKGGQVLLEAEGYKDVAYCGAYRNEAFLDAVGVTPDSRAETDTRLGFYFYSTVLDGDPFGVFISVADGKIAGSAPAGEETPLSHWVYAQ